MTQIGCGGLGVAGAGGDSVIRVTQFISETAGKSDVETTDQNIGESVTVVVT